MACTATALYTGGNRAAAPKLLESLRHKKRVRQKITIDPPDTKITLSKAALTQLGGLGRAHGLSGTEPKSHQHLCSKKAGKRGVGFGNFDGTRLVLIPKATRGKLWQK